MMNSIYCSNLRICAVVSVVEFLFPQTFLMMIIPWIILTLRSSFVSSSSFEVKHPPMCRNLGPRQDHGRAHKNSCVDPVVGP